jgi:HD-GYP domain-containing protein (c-di-GMP phosphodiesterase class II)
MNTDQYIAIDKKILKQELSFGFDLYIPLVSSNSLSCLLKSGSPITHDEKVIIDTSRAIYIKKSDTFIYEEFYKQLSPLKSINLSKHSLQVYQNASKALNDIFQNPESIQSYKSAKSVVNDILKTILHEHFTIRSMLDVITRDYYTHTHSINVAIYALALGENIGLKEGQLLELGEAALLHDLGKTKVSSAIINKKGKLTESEYDEAKKHSEYGYTLGVKIGIKNEAILLGIKHHHERMDGSGYPMHIKGENIPLYARIICLCDIFDALTSRRTYKEPMNTFDAFKLIKSTMGNHIDHDLLHKMVKIFR